MFANRIAAVLFGAALALASAAGPAVITAAFAFPSAAAAQGFTSQGTGLEAAAQGAGYDIQSVAGCKSKPGGCLPVIIGNVVSGLLGVFGAVFLALIMWGGVQYMFAQGDTTKVKSATQTLQNAILGLLVVAASYAIANFVLNTIGGATSGVSTTGGPTAGPTP